MCDNVLVKEELIEIPNEWAGNCFGCSTKNEHGLKLKVLLSDNGCVSYTKVSEEFCGFDGIVHGGIIATLLDEIAAWTLVVHIKKLCVTQEAKIKYFKPVFVNKTIMVEGQIKELNDRSVKTIAYVKNLDGTILAQSESTWIVPELQMLAKLTGKDVDAIKEMYNKFMKPIEGFKKKSVLGGN